MIVRTETSQQVYKVQFIKQHTERKKKPCVDTTCLISFDMDGGWEGLSRGTARQSHKDVYNHVVGKKIAMTRALEGCGFLKCVRTMFWEEFAKEFGDWK